MVSDLVKIFVAKILDFLLSSNVYAIFDRYYSCSIKSMTREQRTGAVQTDFMLTTTTPLPSKKHFLHSVSNKVRLVSLIVEELKAVESPKKLVITGESQYPVEVTDGIVIERRDMRCTHEEADLIIVNQVVSAVAEGEKDILVICDDADVYLLLFHFYISKGLHPAKILMQGASRKRLCTDIGLSAASHSDITGSLLAFHALTGCDSVPGYYGSGKVGTLQLLRRRKLTKIGKKSSSREDVLREGKCFLSEAYKTKPHEDMTLAR